MPIVLTDSDNISIIHTAERLQINLLPAKESVREMVIEVFFIIETQLPNGKPVGFPHWDGAPLILTCKDNPELAEAMRVIQQAIGQGRYLQITAPPVPESVTDLGTMPSPTM